jgi:hypothetical protein
MEKYLGSRLLNPANITKKELHFKDFKGKRLSFLQHCTKMQSYVVNQETYNLMPYA